MKSIIRELYNGNLSPADKPLYKNPKLKKKMDQAEELEERLRKVLDNPQLKMLEEFSETQMNIVILNGEERFTDGFKMGMRFAVDSLTDKEPKELPI